MAQFDQGRRKILEINKMIDTCSAMDDSTLAFLEQG
jgi:hypothetical protein